MSKNSRGGCSMPLSISQNFLTGAGTIRRLLRMTSISRRDYVIEIGAGKGHITRELIKVCGRVDAYELDEGLARHLRDSLGGAENLRILRRDFLLAPLPKMGPYKVFANIPFSITSGIIRKLTSAPNPPAEAWLVMEKGAAKRFLGKPHESKASLALKPFFEGKVLVHLSPEDFHPAPRVDTVLVHLARKAQPDIPPSQRQSFAGFVERGLHSGIGRLLTKKQVSVALRLAGLPQIQPSGEILYIQWLCLFRCYCRFHGGR